MKKLRNKRNIYIMMLTILLAGFISLTVFPPYVKFSLGGEKIAHNRVVIIRLKNIAFSPTVIHIKRGTTVRWINLDPFTHDVTSGRAITGRRARQVKKTKFPDGIFHSGTFGKNMIFEYTFTKKGKYHYYCSIHPVMQGDIIVE